MEKATADEELLPLSRLYRNSRETDHAWAFTTHSLTRFGTIEKDFSI